MKIYSTRHGQTDYNKQGIIMGSTFAAQRYRLSAG